MNKWSSHASKISLHSTAMESRKGRASTTVCRRNQLLLGAIVKCMQRDKGSVRESLSSGKAWTDLGQHATLPGSDECYQRRFDTSGDSLVREPMIGQMGMKQQCCLSGTC